MNKKSIEELKKALLAYVPGETVEAGDAKYGFSGEGEFFRAGGVEHTVYSFTTKAPESLGELEKRLKRIHEETEGFSREFTSTIETWLAVLGQLVGT